MTMFTELQASHALRDTYGVSGMPAPLFHSIARGLKVLLAADGVMHPAELNGYLETCRRYGASEAMLRDLQEFDPMRVTLEECFAGVDPMAVPVRSLMYDVIRIAKADGVYARAERRAVTQAAHMLGIDDDWLEKIVALVDAEDALRMLRLRLLAPEVREVRILQQAR